MGVITSAKNNSDSASPVVTRMSRYISSETQTMASGATVASTAFSTHNAALLGVVVPSVFTGASLTFNVTGDGVNYFGLSDETGTAVSVPIGTARAYALPASLAAWPKFQIVSASAQDGARNLIVVSKG